LNSQPLIPGAPTRDAGSSPAPATTAWRPAAAGQKPVFASIPTIHAARPVPDLPDLDIWDAWPLERASGAVALVERAQLWMALCAPWRADPDERHHIARIRLFSERAGAWRDHGDLFPDGFTPGSREWSGSAILAECGRRVTVYFTATGERGSAVGSFRQRIFETTGQIGCADGGFICSGWSAPQECFVADGVHYLDYDGLSGVPGTIKGFRDPGYFRDPADGQAYLFFTGTDAHSHSPWNGVIGVAMQDRAQPSGWRLLPPVLSAVGTNNELERPHMRCAGGRYYLFWSTQAKTFAPTVGEWPTGLYGMVADSPLGPFRPLNGTGLVAGNPPERPYQAYSWWVMSDLGVASFVDIPEPCTPSQFAAPAFRRSHFVGGAAPLFHLALSGDTASVRRD